MYCDSKTGVQFTQLISAAMGTCGRREASRLGGCRRVREAAAASGRGGVGAGACVRGGAGGRLAARS